MEHNVFSLSTGITALFFNDCFLNTSQNPSNAAERNAKSNHIISFTLFKTEGKVTTKNKQRSVDFDINGTEIKEKGDREIHLHHPFFYL